MPDSNQQFLQDPKLFATLHAVYPQQDMGNFVMDGAHIKRLDLGNDSDLQQVQGPNKVQYCHVQRAGSGVMIAGDFGDIYDDDLNLYVMRISNAPLSSTAFPVYYLPWAPDATARMKLKPSRKHPTRDGSGHTVDPAVFVTAAVQGCSIFIDGKPEEPVVYHLNATSTGGEIFQKTTTREAQDSLRAKVGVMADRHHRAQARYPKEGPRVGTGHARLRSSTHQTSHMSDYMPDFITSQGRQALTQRHATPPSIWNLWGLLAAEWQYETIQAGTVFGIRTNGKWAFYRQTRTRLSYNVHVPGDSPYDLPRVVRESRWVGTRCVQFWPVYRG